MSITRKQLNKHWKVIEAFKNGANIECKSHINDAWDVISDPMWSIDYEYRVKKEPKLVPFTIDDINLLIGKGIRIKHTNPVHLIIGVRTDDVQTYYNRMSYECLLDKYEFIDGSPCGKIE